MVEVPGRAAYDANAMIIGRVQTKRIYSPAGDFR